MSVTVAIHQPNFLPWLSYFDKIDRVDVFILLDKVQFTRRSFIQRVKVLNKDTPAFITVPVCHVGKQEFGIDEARIDNDTNYIKKITGTLLHNYCKQRYWKQYGEPVIDIINKRYEALLDLNLELLKFITKSLDISWEKIEMQSSREFRGKKSELMASLTKSVGGDIYLSGGNESTHYNDPAVYRDYGVVLEYQNFSHPKYNQGTNDFYPGLSIIDALVRFGKKTIEMLRDSNGRR